VVDFKLAPGDRVVAAFLSDGEGEYLVVSSDGKALRFGESEVRPTGRGTQGIVGMSLAKGAHVVAAGAIGHKDSGALLVVSDNGYGKRTPFAEFPVKGRGTQGVQATTGAVPGRGENGGFTIGAVALIPDQADVLLRTTAGGAVRLAAREIPSQGRASRGSILVKLEPPDKIAGLAVFPPEA
jgi:DNA gyrase subunit A